MSSSRWAVRGVTEALRTDLYATGILVTLVVPGLVAMNYVEATETMRERMPGAMPQAIHMYAEDVVGRPLPCQAGEGQECPYTSNSRFDAAEIDVLIGHYTHAYNRRVAEGRAVVVDEFPEGTYEQGFNARLASAVTTFLQAHDEIPFADYMDFIEHRDHQARRGEGLCWFEDRELERDVDQTFAGGHVAAPLVTYTLLAGPTDRLGNGWERARIDERRLGCYDREEGAVWLLQPQDLQCARAVVALDDIPTQEIAGRHPDTRDFRAGSGHAADPPAGSVRGRVRRVSAGGVEPPADSHKRIHQAIRLPRPRRCRRRRRASRGDRRRARPPAGSDHVYDRPQGVPQR